MPSSEYILYWGHAELARATSEMRCRDTVHWETFLGGKWQRCGSGEELDIENAIRATARDASSDVDLLRRSQPSPASMAGPVRQRTKSAPSNPNTTLRAGRVA
jgi:hypothetical protein